MREKKFTPGPWEYERGDDEIFPGKHFVVYDETVCDETVICTPLNGKHDANLIAAAPELLEALEEVMRVYIIGQGKQKKAIYDLAQAAIAKAYGE